MQAREVIFARGHKHITAMHKTTFEFTRDVDISKRADCIIAVEASKSAAELSEEFKILARNSGARITVDIFSENVHERIMGMGSKGLSFSHPRDLVGRRSTFTCERTLMVHADKAAIDLKKELVKNLRLERDVVIHLLVELK